jgi:hypothetical protein
MSGVMDRRRLILPAIVAVFVIGAIVGAVLHRVLTRHGPPSLQASLHMTLRSDDFFGSPEMELYANGLAGELNARFHRPHTALHYPDLQVVARPPGCFESRIGCGTVVRWTFEIHSKDAIDAAVVSIAVGRGNLVLRAVEDGRRVTCDGLPKEYPPASVTAPFVPESFSGTGCLHLGPALHTVVGAPVLASTAYPQTRASTVRVTLSSEDANWLGSWSRSHADTDVAVVLDGWIIGRVRRQTIAELTSTMERARKIGVSRPMELTSIAVHAPMDSAIALAIQSGAATKPQFELPIFPE